MAQRQSQRVRVLRGGKKARLDRPPAQEASGEPPPMPDWLNERQAQLWRWLDAELAEAGLRRPLAAGPMTDWVTAVYLRDNAAEELSRQGITTKGKRGGETVKHPSVMTWRAASEVARRAERQLGITPPVPSPPVAPDPGYRDPARLLYWPDGHPG